MSAIPDVDIPACCTRECRLFKELERLRGSGSLSESGSPKNLVSLKSGDQGLL